MMTSRCEYRLLLRQDNADQRLTPEGWKLGLISDQRYQRLQEKEQQVEQELHRVQHLNLAPDPNLNAFLEANGTAPLSTGCKLADLVRRPQLNYAMLAPFDKTRPSLPEAVAEQVNLQIKYAGYIEKQLLQVEQTKRLESRLLPEHFDYSQIRGLRLEAAEKLTKLQPHNIGQASRISGVSPADISMLHVWLTQNGGAKH